MPPENVTQSLDEWMRTWLFEVEREMTGYLCLRVRGVLTEPTRSVKTDLRYVDCIQPNTTHSVRQTCSIRIAPEESRCSDPGVSELTRNPRGDF